MFGIFKKQKQKEKVKKQPVAVKKSDPREMSSTQVLQALNQIQKELDRLKLAVTGGVVSSNLSEADNVVEEVMNELKNRDQSVVQSDNSKIIEGVFDGQHMIGADGQQYDVPANYASKSKLVEGDILKLTINNLGAFVYKQIKPIERARKVGVLEQDAQSLQFFAVAEGKKWKLLTASVTYFKGEIGDELVFFIPAEGGSRWAALDNVVK